MPHISSRFSHISESQTVALTTLAAKLRREGRDIISLGAGEPDFETPEHIRHAAIRAVHEGYTKYTPVSGALDLKEAISQWMKEEHGADYSSDEIVVTCGAKHAIYQSILAICDPGDEVLVPLPYWVSYPEQIKLAQAVMAPLIPLDNAALKITAEQIEKAITRNTRALVFNSPGNPSGMVYNFSELEAIARVIKDSGIYVISDEIYDKIVFDEMSYTSLTAFKDIRDQLIYVNGVSKSYAMTGWRIGFLAAHKDIALAITTYQGHSTTNPASISQRAALEAYQSDKGFILDMLAAFQQRRDYVVGRLNAMRGVKCVVPQGAFYAFPDVSMYYTGNTGIKTSLELCSYLLEKFDIAVVPGSAFGMDNHIRLSYAASMDVLEKALDRIDAGLKSLD